MRRSSENRSVDSAALLRHGMSPRPSGPWHPSSGKETREGPNVASPKGAGESRWMRSEYPGRARRHVCSFRLQLSSGLRDHRISCIVLSLIFRKTRSRPDHGHLTSGGRLIRIASVWPPVFRPNNVPRSCRRLNSTYRPRRISCASRSSGVHGSIMRDRMISG